MTEVFLKLLNMSIAAGWLILVVIILRVLLKRVPKWTRFILWAFVAVRLVCPFSFESVFSLIPSAETVPQEIMYMKEPTIHTGVLAVNNIVNPLLAESMAPLPENSVNPVQVVTAVAANVWLLGLFGMLLYAVGSFFGIKRKVAASMRLSDKMYLCDYIETPFILGIIKPRIYIPSTLEKENITYVIAHEEAHMKRRDHLWKPLGFALLSVYWFHPLMWVAYVLLCRDIELACDERVIRELGEREKKSYSNALLTCSISRKRIVACPLAFGEVGVKERVRTVLNYKKPAFWMIVVAMLVCAAVAVCFLTNPKGEGESDSGKLIESKETDNNSGRAETAEKAVQDITAERYVSVECLFMNPLSSYFAVNGDSGEIYYVTEDSFIIKNRASGNEQIFNSIEWEWTEFPYTDEEWSAMLVPGSSAGVAKITERYQDIQYLKLSEEYCLLQVEGKLWLVSMKNIYKMGKCLWSAYVLEKEGSMGTADWEYKPMFSSQYPAFPIEFALEDAEITAYCTNGVLVDFDNDGREYPQGSSLTVASGDKIYWYPKVYESDTLQVESETVIRFNINKAGMMMYFGTIYITKDNEEGIAGIYTASLVSANMFMKQNEEALGAVITPAKAVEMVSGEEKASDPLEQAIHDAILGEDKGLAVKNAFFPCESHVILGTEERDREHPTEAGVTGHYLTVYAMALKQSYVFKEPYGEILDDGGSHMPVAITFEVTGENEYHLVEYWQPMDGSYYVSSIREKFPDNIEEEAIDTQKYIYAQIRDCYAQAVVFGSVDTDGVIEELFKKIESSPAEASNAAAYLDAHSLEHRELRYYGDYTLRYIFDKFLNGGQTGLRGQLMRLVLDELAPEAALRLYTETGQEYFDEWLEKAQELCNKKGEDWMKENQPASWLCLEMKEVLSE